MQRKGKFNEEKKCFKHCDPGFVDISTLQESFVLMYPARVISLLCISPSKGLELHRRNNFPISATLTSVPRNPLQKRAFAKGSASAPRTSRPRQLTTIDPPKSSAKAPKERPNNTSTTIDKLDTDFPQADQYKYIAHLLTMPIRTPEATRKVWNKLKRELLFLIIFCCLFFYQVIFEQLKDVTEDEYFKQHPRTPQCKTEPPIYSFTLSFTYHLAKLALATWWSWARTDDLRKRLNSSKNWRLELASYVCQMFS